MHVLANHYFDDVEDKVGLKWVGCHLCERWIHGHCFPLEFNLKFNDYH